VKLVLDQRHFARENIAIDVVEQVEADEQQQRPLGGGEAVAKRLKRSRQSVNPARGITNITDDR
jgi:hypothetical protein